ncbi:hypothetical protein FEM48_Zijuj03G0078900 [Ziziphus jujuba var. spinosa]|uniref:3-ketoacyl-CoA synthase n=1 Tax=Ziziphus jujuba var. spinosa TaxID=714518 RepID=A0A978VP33_ZIZJJ|nr:hypothetical protein FEM48_Zijuj03G0078900 [Ziziphus jujuba var. spinosa]
MNISHHMEFPMLAVCLFSVFYTISILWKIVLQWRSSDRTCYMLAYECFKPADFQKVDVHSSAEIILRNKNLGLEDYRFMLKTMASSGLGEETYGPKTVMAGREQCPTLSDAFSEMDEIIFGTLDKLFARTQIPPSEISILIVNVALFAPSPSLTSRIVNRYKMKEDIKSFNLSGMGCSASIIAVEVVQNLFVTYKNSYAIVVSTECMGTNWYCGKERSMMISNILFRSGGCSMLFTNKKALKHRSILKLNCLVRTHTGSDDEAYNCCIEVEDEEGYKGFHLSKNLTKVAAKALTSNLKVLLPKILPLSEQLRYMILLARNKIRIISSSKTENARIDLNIKSGIDHFCVHPGSRGVIDGIGKSLKLSEYDLEPSRMALHRFGNTSSGGFWYALGYMEAKKRLKKGDKILMIGLGAGFKCNNCVWEVTRDLDDVNVWRDCIDSYPRSSGVNPFKETYGWINEEYLNFVRFDPTSF